MRQLTASEASNDEMERKKFEAAMRNKFGDLVDLSVCRNGDGEYLAWDAQVAYYAWQAAFDKASRGNNENKNTRTIWWLVDGDNMAKALRLGIRQSLE